jgi:aldose 1-epimerase
LKTNKKYCFTNSCGEDIYLFALRNSKGTETLITNYGAIITSFKIIDKYERTTDIVLGFDRVEDYLDPSYLQQYAWFGSAIGRYANRIKNASFNLNGRHHKLSVNRGRDQLHGGINGFDKKTWKELSSGKDWLELNYQSPDGEEGFPGKLDVKLRFELNENNELSYEYKAVTDQPTAVNLSHHSYFNLNEEGSVADHDLKIFASYILGQDDNLVADGRLLPVANQVFDFREFKNLGNSNINLECFDISYLIDEGRQDKKIVMPVAELRSRKTGLLLRVDSTEPVVHFYSGRWIPPVNAKNQMIYEPYSGLCLETQKHPNAVNIPSFPNTVLNPGEEYYQKTVYGLSD